VRRRPAATLRLHRSRRAHRRQRQEIARLMLMVSVAIERGFEQVIGFVDAKLRVKRR
jgi:hypothetical protein